MSLCYNSLMFIIRLLFLALAIACAAFGYHPAQAYSNFGGYVLLALAAIFFILTFFIGPIRSLMRHTVLGKILSIIITLVVLYFGTVHVLIFINGRPTDTLPKADVVIVLGAVLAYDSDQPSTELALRLDKAKEYLEQHPNAIAIVTGGKGTTEKVSEAYAMKQYLILAGITPERVIMEDKAGNTAENLKFSTEILRDRGLSLPVIITSDYHCFRAKLLAPQAGLPENTPCIPAPNVWWLAPADQVRESFSVTKALWQKLFP